MPKFRKKPGVIEAWQVHPNDQMTRELPPKWLLDAMTITTCDLCGERIRQPLTITVGDGTYPSNGSALTRAIDCCAACAP